MMDIFAESQEWIDTGRGNKYYRVACELKRRIDAGEIAYRLPSLPQISREFNITPMTAHRAIRLLKEHGIAYAEQGRGTFVTRLKRVRSNTIGSILLGIAEGPLHSSLASGIREACNKHDQHMLLEHHDNDSERELGIICKLWEEQKVDGFILWPSYPNGGIPKAVTHMLEERIPFVLVPEVNPELFVHCHTVSTDQSRMIGELVDHLVEIGHKRIGYMDSGTPDNPSYRPIRWRGYCAAMEQHGLETIGPLTVPGDLIGDTFHYDRSFVSSLQKMSAIVCVTDSMAIKLTRICLREGIRVPRDLAMVGYDNNREAQELGITTVDQHFERIGADAVSILIKEVEGKLSHPVHGTVRSDMIIRASTAGESFSCG